MRKTIILVLIAVGCLGHSCVPPETPLPGHGQLTRQDGIPRGLYEGVLTQNMTYVFIPDADAEPEESPASYLYCISKAFGPTGVPTTAEGLPLRVGDIKGWDLGTLYETGVVTSIEVDKGRLVVWWDITMSLRNPGEDVVDLVGTEQEVYELLPSGDVFYRSVEDASGPMDDGVLHWHYEDEGTLSLRALTACPFF